SDPDLVMAQSDRIRLQRLHGFSLADSDTVAYATDAIAVADFDRDGDLDLAASGSDRVVVWLNDGDGALTFGSQHVTDVEAESMSAGDLNGDGFADLIGVNRHPDFSRFRFYGHGDGT